MLIIHTKPTIFYTLYDKSKKIFKGGGGKPQINFLREGFKIS